MQFGPVPTPEAEGAVLAHSLAAGDTRLKKGRRLSAADVGALLAGGIATVTVARLEPDDVPEDEAAAAVVRALAPNPTALGLAASAPFTGRANLFAASSGILRIDAAAVDRLNAVDPSITLATLPDHARVEARGMIATVKIIPYAVPRDRLARALAALGTDGFPPSHPSSAPAMPRSSGAPAEAPPGSAPAAARPVDILRLHPFRPLAADLILTRTPGLKPSLIDKGARAVADRLAGLGLLLAPPRTVPHETESLAAALRDAAGDIALILTASATSDEADTGPAALLAAGGRLERFGMPVDPGNLLFLGTLGGRPVVGLPGCVRSPALNGADWVLERLAAGLPVTGGDIARLGVGGLLKEIPTRPQPRAARPSPAATRPRVEAILLAAGFGRRMMGRDKLLEPVAGAPVLAVAARAALASAVERVLVVLPPGAPARRAALGDLPVEIVEAPQAAEGMAASLRAGLAEVSAEADAVIVLLADMPEIEAEHLDRLIAAFDPAEGRDICRAVDANGIRGHPVLFGRRFFESLAALSGDRGARDILRQAADYLVDVPTPGRGATLDLDTPAAWESWRLEGGA